MEIAVKEVDELPSNHFISVRYGDMRRQAPFRRGERFAFPGTSEKAYTVDVFRKVGTKQICLAGIEALGGKILSENIKIPSLELNGTSISVSLCASLTGASAEHVPKESKKQQVAKRAKSYFDKNAVEPLMHDLFARLLERLPSDPLSFMIDFLEQRREEAEDRCSQRDFAHEPGLGDAPFPGFADGRHSGDLPNLARHHSLLADVLRSDPGIYEGLRFQRTSLDVTLAQCIKPGIDCPGHELVKVAGVYAGDEESYRLFQGVFDPIIGTLHNAFPADTNHLNDLVASKLTSSQIDPSGRYAVFATLDIRRNLSGLRLATCCSRDERREVERLLTRSMVDLHGDLKSSYYPLRSSQSYVPKVGGMSHEQEEQLRSSCVLFSEPDSKMRLAAGLGRQWPDARGICVNDKQSFFIWCNEEDHLRFFGRQHNIDIKGMWRRTLKAVSTVEKSMASQGYTYMRSEHLGYITTCPSRLGTGLRVTVSLKVPMLAASVDLPALCQSLQLQSSQEVGSVSHGSVWNISNADCLGVSEVDILNCLIEGCATLVLLEQRVEKGEPIYDAVPGLGDQPFPGFSSRRCPAHMPDLSNHHTLAAGVLRDTPALYRQLRLKKTSKSVGLAPCIKPGMDDRGHPNVMPGAGIVFGDEECYTLFEELFGPIISKLHGGFSPSQCLHPTDDKASKLSDATIDPTGARIASVRVELRRNISGFRFAPCCERAERREVERALVGALSALGGDWQGSYMPLSWSESYEPKPGGMTKAEETELRDQSRSFPEPASVQQLSAGLGRNWPDARGVYLANGQDLFAWCNEADHLVAVAEQKGSDLKDAFVRVSTGLARLEAELGEAGHTFARDRQLGYLTVAPEHLGNGLRCIVSIKLPRFATHEDFSKACQALKLRPVWRDGAWDLASEPHLGVCSSEAVTGVIEGCAWLVSVEEKLGRGEAIDAELESLRL